MYFSTRAFLHNSIIVISIALEWTGWKGGMWGGGGGGGFYLDLMLIVCYRYI